MAGPCPLGRDSAVWTDDYSDLASYLSFGSVERRVQYDGKIESVVTDPGLASNRCILARSAL